MGIPLGVARGARLPGEAWTPRDWALQQAVEMLDRSKCPGCGQPAWMAHDAASKWRPKKVRCESCNAIEDLKATLPEDVKNPQALHFYTEHVP
jgi:hypothetical protein